MTTQIMERQTESAADYVTAFREALSGAVDGIRRAARIYVEAIDEEPERAQEFRAACPEIPEGTWATLDKIGRGQVDVRLLMRQGGPHRARIARLPGPMQTRLLDGEPVDLLLDAGEEVDSLKVDVRNVTSEQAAQLFAGDHIRSVAEQKAWLAEREQRAKLAGGDPIETLPYVIQGNKVTFKRNLTMTLRELKDLIQVMAC